MPDFLALVGDAADGYPGVARIGKKTAARLLNRYGTIETFPPEVLGEVRTEALLFKQLATLKTDAPLFENVDELRWRGSTAEFAGWVKRLGDDRLARVRIGDRAPARQQLIVHHPLKDVRERQEG